MRGLTNDPITRCVKDITLVVEQTQLMYQTIVSYLEAREYNLTVVFQQTIILGHYVNDAVLSCQKIFKTNSIAVKEELLLASPAFRDFDFGKCVASIGVIIQKTAPIAQELHDDPSLFDIDKIFDETNPLIDQFTDLIEAFDPTSKACGIHF
eukprot:TRINITY_DN393_c0_g1_i14.p2 TRINITY_DN393_c0_g1~~TRINITY_DN393_c0_g1_i14.p2  ORF type:complete len:152 (-),score=28.92 TRINITY_DN393_c0_g1_i14:91-546(-)